MIHCTRFQVASANHTIKIYQKLSCWNTVKITVSNLVYLLDLGMKGWTTVIALWMAGQWQW